MLMKVEVGNSGSRAKLKMGQLRKNRLVKSPLRLDIRLKKQSSVIEVLCGIVATPKKSLKMFLRKAEDRP